MAEGKESDVSSLRVVRVTGRPRQRSTPVGIPTGKGPRFPPGPPPRGVTCGPFYPSADSGTTAPHDVIWANFDPLLVVHSGRPTIHSSGLGYAQGLCTRWPDFAIAPDSMPPCRCTRTIQHSLVGKTARTEREQLS